MRIAILGGGVGGLSLAHALRSLAPVPPEIDLFEQAPVAGGLVGRFQHAGRWYDRHYHVVLLGDEHLRALIRILDLDHLLTFTPSRAGFWDGARVIPFNGPWDLLRFPYLTLVDKARLTATLFHAQRWGDPLALHQTEIEPWLVRLGGRRTFDRIWAPLLRTKFDGSFEGLPATYLWSRIRRMQSTREGGVREKIGILRGGTQVLVGALVKSLSRMEGVQIHTGARVAALVPEAHATGVVLDGGGRHGPYDLVVSTLPTPVHEAVAAPAGAGARVRTPDRYLGIVDVVVVLKRALTSYYTLYLLDASLPFTGVIEPTNLVPESARCGVHLVYLPRYTAVEGDEYRQPDHVLKRRYVDKLKAMFPDLGGEDVDGVYLFRDPFVEPVHLVGGEYPRFPESLGTHRRGVYLMNTGRLYPLLHNCEAVVALAGRTARFLLERHA